MYIIIIKRINTKGYKPYLKGACLLSFGRGGGGGGDAFVCDVLFW